MTKRGEPDGLSLPYFKLFKLYRIYADEFAIVYSKNVKGLFLFFDWKSDQDGHFNWEWYESKEGYLKDNLRYTRTKLPEQALHELIEYLFKGIGWKMML
jgi:hypothetical protein